MITTVAATLFARPTLRRAFYGLYFTPGFVGECLTIADAARRTAL